MNAEIFVGKVGGNTMSDIFMDTAKVMPKRQVTIPKRIRELLNLENRDYATFLVNKNKVEIRNSNVLIKQNIKNKRRCNKNMTIEEIKKLIQNGEKINVEFKESGDSLTKNVFDSVCSFNTEQVGIFYLS